MNDKLNQKTINQIIKQHSLWLKSHGNEGKRAQLKRKYFENIDFENANLENAVLSFSYFINCNFINSNLEKAVMSQVNIENCNFKKAKLSDINLYKSRLIKLDMTDVNLSQANLRKTMIDMVNFENSNISKSNLSKAEIRDVSFNNALLEDLGLESTKILIKWKKQIKSYKGKPIWKTKRYLNTGITVKIDGEKTKIDNIICHHQKIPKPGGHNYEIIISNEDLINSFEKYFKISKRTKRFLSKIKHADNNINSAINFIKNFMEYRNLIRSRKINWVFNNILDVKIKKSGLIIKGIASKWIKNFI